LPYSDGDDVPADEAPDVVAHLITCESQGVSVKATTAISVGIWAVENGYLSQWSCAKILFGQEIGDCVPANSPRRPGKRKRCSLT
jgi:hypothetical protein